MKALKTMKRTVQQLVWVLMLAALPLAAFAAADTASADKAQQAVATLKSATASPADKALACKRLAVYGQADAVPALVPLLADEQLGAWARTALEAIPGNAPDKALREALGKLQGRLLVGVINSIGVRRDAKAVSALAAKLKDADESVAVAAAIALGRIGGDSAAKALQNSLADRRTEVRSAAARGCIFCGEQLFAGKAYSKAAKLYDIVRKADLPKQRIAEATRGAILARFSNGLPLLLETLRSPDKAMFAIGLSTARELPGRGVTDALVAELRQIAAERQPPLLLALADRNDPAVAPVLLEYAKGGAKPLRLTAIEVLGRLGSGDAVSVLLDAVVDSDAELAAAAKTALAGLPASEVDAPVAARLRTALGGARLPLIQLAGQRQIAAAMPELARAAGDADAKVRAAGLKALGETAGVADLGTLTDLLARAKSDDEISDVQEALESACARLTDKAACAGQLLPRFAALATPAKCALLRVLVVVGTPDALETVRGAITSADAKVRDAAVRTLADWPDAAALPALLEVWRSTTDDSHRFLALRGCVRLLESSPQPAADKVKTFGELLERSPRADDRKVILSGVANVADPAALQLIEPLTESALEAEVELARIGIAEKVAKSVPAVAEAIARELKAKSKSPAVRDRAAKLLRNGK